MYILQHPKLHEVVREPNVHEKSKHIEIKYHYIWYMVQRGAMKLQYVAMYEKITDVLTNLLAKVKFEYFRERLGVIQNEAPRKRE